MTGRQDVALFTRSQANPILTAADVPYPANCIFNPGVARVGNETILLVRVEDLHLQLHVAGAPTGSRTGGSTRAPTWIEIPKRRGAARTLA